MNSTPKLTVSPQPSVEQLKSLQRRYGRMRVTRDLLLKQVLAGSDEGLAAFNAIFTNFVIVRAETDFHTDTIVYDGYHPHFDECPENASYDAREYVAEISRTVEDHGITTYTAKMVRRSW